MPRSELIDLRQDMTDSKQLVKSVFSQRAAEWAATYSASEQRVRGSQTLMSRQRLALQMVDATVPPPAKILDAGCGSGDMAAKLIERGYDVWGVDLAEPMIRHARILCRSDQFGVGDIEQIPFPDNTFDAVVSLGVIEYLDADDLALREIWRVLRPGGRAILATPNATAPLQQMDRMLLRLTTALRPAYYFVKYGLSGRPLPAHQPFAPFPDRRYHRRRWLQTLRSLNLEPEERICHGWGWYKSSLGHFAYFLAGVIERGIEGLFGSASLLRASDRFVRNRALNWAASEQIVRVRAVK